LATENATKRKNAPVKKRKKGETGGGNAGVRFGRLLGGGHELLEVGHKLRRGKKKKWVLQWRFQNRKG